MNRRQERLAFTLAACCGAAWLGTLVFGRPTRGKDWRGYEGVVRLQPGIVYRFGLLAPFDLDVDRDMTQPKNQEILRQALEATGARNVSFSVADQGVLAAFDQSFSEPRQLDFGAIAVGTFRPVTARRLDGLDWEAP